MDTPHNPLQKILLQQSHKKVKTIAVIRNISKLKSLIEESKFNHAISIVANMPTEKIETAIDAYVGTILRSHDSSTAMNNILNLRDSLDQEKGMGYGSFKIGSNLMQRESYEVIGGSLLSMLACNTNAGGYAHAARSFFEKKGE